MTLADFLNRHPEEVAWVFGKGPSLTTFDPSTAGKLRCSINDTVRYIPGIVYAFANDGIRHYADAFTAGQVLFQPLRCMGEYDTRVPGSVACDVVHFTDHHCDDRLYESREEIATGLAIRRGTLGSCLQILHIMGVRTVHLVGIDGGQALADGFQWGNQLRPDSGAEYHAIRNEAIDAASILGIKLIFHTTNPMETNDGKIFVRILRNCLAEAVHYCEGQIISFNPRVAHELVFARAAEYHEHPVKPAAPAVETAEAKAPARAEKAAKK